MPGLSDSVVLGYRAWWAGDFQSASRHLSEVSADDFQTDPLRYYFIRYLSAFSDSMASRLTDDEAVARGFSGRAQGHLAWIRDIHARLPELVDQEDLPEKFETIEEATASVGVRLARIEDQADRSIRVLASLLPPRYSATNFKRMMEAAEKFKPLPVQRVGAFFLTVQDLDARILGRAYIPKRVELALDRVPGRVVVARDTYRIVWDEKRAVTSAVWREGRIASQLVRCGPEDARGLTDVVETVTDISSQLGVG